MKYKVIGISIILSLTILIAGFIWVGTDDLNGERQQAEEFLRSAVGAQNAARLVDISQVQGVLDTYFGANGVYPGTLTEISGSLPQLHQTDISNPEHIVYEQTRDGQGYIIDFSFVDGRRFQLNETQSALDYQVEAERIPEEFFSSSEYQESIQQLAQQEKTLREEVDTDNIVSVGRTEKEGVTILSPQFKGLPGSGNKTGVSVSKDGNKIAFGWSHGFEDNSIWVMDIKETQARKIWEGEVTAMRGASRELSFSPDASKIMMTVLERNSGNTGDVIALYVMDSSGDNGKKLSLQDQSIEMPLWTPNGREIIFRDRGLSDESKEKFFAVDVNSGVQNDVAEIEGRVLHYEISPRDNEIFFLVQSKVGERQVLSNDIVRFNRNSRKGSHFASSEIDESTFSIDLTGSRIVYFEGRTSYPFLKDMVIANVSGSGRQVVQNYNEGRDAKTTNIVWHPDGSKIALREVTRNLKGSVNIFSIESLSFTRIQSFTELDPSAILSWSQTGDMVLTTARRSEPFLLIRNFE